MFGKHGDSYAPDLTAGEFVLYAYKFRINFLLPFFYSRDITTQFKLYTTGQS